MRFLCSGSKTCPKWKFYKVLSYFTIISLLHGVICITKYQHRFCFPTSFPLFVAWSFCFLCRGDQFISLPQGTYIIRFTIHMDLVLSNLTHILSKSIYKEICSRLESFQYIFISKQKWLGVSLQCNKHTCYYLSILMFIDHYKQRLFI